MSPAPPEVSRLGWLWLVGGLALVVAPHLLRLPPWLGLVCVAAIGWRVARDQRGWPLPGPLLRFVLTTAGIGAVLWTFGTVLGREAGAALLTVMLTLKLVEMRSLRDAIVVIVLAYFLVATGFLFSASLFNGLYLLLAVIVLTAALVVLNHPAAEARLGPRYLRRAGEMMVQSLPLMVLLFILFPRVSGSVWGLAADDRTGRTGLSGDMDIGDVARLADSGEVAFRVEFEKQPPSSMLYWRGPVLWHTDGRRWTGLSLAQARTIGTPPRFAPLDDAIAYRMTLEPHRQRWLLALDLPAHVPPDALVTPDFQLLAKHPVERLQRYDLRSHLHYRTVGLDAQARALALTLPAGKHPRARALAAAWTKEHQGTALTQRALRWFSEEAFYYSREPPPLGTDPIDGFLFETRRGFCEHYAAAFVVLMRAGGLPARVVTGYQGGEKNPLADYFVVRQSDAHAWAEVYLDEQGWVRMDPTAVIPPSRIESAADVSRFREGTKGTAYGPWFARAWKGLRQGWDIVNHGWNQWVLGYGREKQEQLLARLGLDDMGWRGLVMLLAFGCGLALLAAALHVRRQRRQNVDPVMRAFQPVLARLAHHGIVKQPSEGVLAFAERVATEYPLWGTSLVELAVHYNALRYGQAQDPAQLRLFRREVNQFRPSIKRR